MAERSRTYRSIQNSVVGLGFYFIALILSFVSRKVYIDYLGTELLGLNTTAQDLLGFLNLAELGIGSAIACTLYKPLFDKDEEAINEIVSLQGWLYRKIALIVGGGAMVLMAFFPLIFKKIDLPLSYTYLSFGVFLLSSLLSYFINYQSIVLSANQKDYLIKGSYNAVSLVKTVAQILAVRFLSNPYIWWCLLEVVFAFLASYAMHRAVVKDSPFLRTDINRGKELSQKYPDILTKVKQLFFHKIGSFVLLRSGSLILYAVTNLTSVALLGNYYSVTNCIQNLVKAGTGNIGASVGNMIAQGDQMKSMMVFEEIFSIRFYVAGITCICVYFLSSPFISIWLGSQYVLSDSTVLLISLAIFIALSRITVDDFINALGLFSDVWAPVAEAIINVVVAVSLGILYGLNGVLLGGLISQFLIIMMWKPYFLFRYGFHRTVVSYVVMYAKHLLSLLFALFVGSMIISMIDSDPCGGIRSWLIASISHICVYGSLLLLFMSVFTMGMRLFIKRILAFVIQKKI